MRLYNTLTGAIEELTPVTPGHLGIYACGVTPYSESHVGHAMSAIVYDVFVRYLRWAGNPAGGYHVTFVSNYTDVDDKLIDRGRELGVDPLELAEQNIALWEDQQRALNLTFPDVRPRVTTHIEPIVGLTQRLIDNGHAYATPSGDVYFRVRSDEDYGKLSHRNIEELRSGTRFEPGDEKEFPLDFALWKSAKPGEPSWDSPWGRGRPGWHIECSAMSQRYLGDTLDIHGGGMDLVFPHHENEIAQSESATGQPFARVWMHSGLVQRDGEKMSKSIGNVVNVSEALQRWSPDALRLFVLNSHYRSPNNLTDEAMTAAEHRARSIRNAVRPFKRVTKVETKQDYASSLRFQIEDCGRSIARSLEADFDTPSALAALDRFRKEINRTKDHLSDELVSEAQAVLRTLCTEVFGLTLGGMSQVIAPTSIGPTSALGTPMVIAPEPASLTLEGFAPDVSVAGAASDLDVVALSKLASRLEVQCGGTDAESTIEALLANRTEARKNRDFGRADAIRNGLAEAGVEVEDTAEGPRWSVRR